MKSDFDGPPFGSSDFEEIPQCPREGQGVNSWTFIAAVACKRLGLTSLATIEHLLSATNRSDPIKSEEEIVRSVSKVYDSAFRKTGGSPRPRGAKVNQERIDRIVAQGFKVEDLRGESPGDLNVSANAALDLLFPGDPYLCLALDMKNPFVKRKREWLTKSVGNFSYLVPNPMVAMKGRNKEGRISTRCLDNTGERRFFVVEIDPPKWEDANVETPGGVGTPEEYYSRMKDAQAGVLWELQCYAPLAMVTDSGKKSLHGFYLVQGWEEEDEINFFNLATSLGADGAHWTRCQLARLPGGTRNNGGKKKQTIEYLDPSYEGQMI